jgi:hypothetical protein
MKRIFLLHVALATLFLFPDHGVRGSLDSDLDTAFANLVVGRSYLKKFPLGKTRTQLIQDYLGADANGVFDGGGGGFAPLSSALDLTVGLRNRTDAANTNSLYAQYIAWESLEAALSGQLFAGNSDLLNALRVAFPVAGGNGPPGTDRPMPLGTPAKDAAGAEYAGANIKNLGYARLHFFRGLSLLLDFLSADPTGEIPVVDHLTYPQAPTYTIFNNTNTLPGSRFADTNFLAEPQPTQTAAYLYGNILNRFGIANISVADRLWRAAYFGTGGSSVRDEMLNKATTELRRTIHAQFLASLPLAATLKDGNGTDEFGNAQENEYQIARLDQVRSSVSAAANLMDRINRREAPKLDSLNLNVGDTDIQNQINVVAASLNSLKAYYDDAEKKTLEWQQAGQLQASDVQNIRSSFEDEMVRICGLDPAVSPYNGLTSATQRQQYRNDVEALFDQRMKAGLGAASLVDGSDMGKAALNVLRAFSEIEAVQVEIGATPQQIRIEEDRNEEVNSIVTTAGKQVAALDIAVGIIQGTVPSVTVGFPSASVTFAPGATLVAAQEVLQTLVSVNKETSINNANSRATVRNLLLHQAELAARMPSVVAQAQLAIADMNAFHNRLLRLLDDHVFFQQNTANLWYYDPSVLFEQSQAEIRYQDQLKDATIQLYLLAQKLSSRWTEPYQNPPRGADGMVQSALGTVGQFDDFTEPESAFTIGNNYMAKNYYGALQDWDSRLRSQRPFPASNPSTTLTVRQDLLGLSDYEWDPALLTYVVKPDRRDRNIALFRAYLVNAQKVNAPKHYFELELGINYFSPKRSTVTGTGFSAYLIPRSNNDWNQRLASVSARVLGANVTTMSTVPFTIYQYGKTYIQGFFDKDDASHVDDLRLYYRDPRSLLANVGWEGKQQFRVDAAVGGAIPVAVNVADRAISPFCDRYLLTIENSQMSVPVNLQNINDIELTFTWTIGQPANYSWPSVP